MPKSLNVRIDSQLRRALQRAVAYLNRKKRASNTRAAKTPEKMFVEEALREWLQAHGNNATGCEEKDGVPETLSLQPMIADDLKNSLDEEAERRKIDGLPGKTLVSIVEGALLMWLNKNGFDRDGHEKASKAADK